MILLRHINICSWLPRLPSKRYAMTENRVIWKYIPLFEIKRTCCVQQRYAQVPFAVILVHSVSRLSWSREEAQAALPKQQSALNCKRKVFS